MVKFALVTLLGLSLFPLLQQPLSLFQLYKTSAGFDSAYVHTTCTKLHSERESSPSQYTAYVTAYSTGSVYNNRHTFQLQLSATNCEYTPSDDQTRRKFPLPVHNIEVVPVVALDDDLVIPVHLQSERCVLNREKKEGKYNIRSCTQTKRKGVTEGERDLFLKHCIQNFICLLLHSHKTHTKEKTHQQHTGMHSLSRKCVQSTHSV